MKPPTILIAAFGLMLLVLVSMGASEIFWSNKKNTPDPIRELVCLPSISIGNLSPSARNPGLEMFCTGLYDNPGGYCSYFTGGVPFTGFPAYGNITVADNEG